MTAAVGFPITKLDYQRASRRHHARSVVAAMAIVCLHLQIITFRGAPVTGAVATVAALLFWTSRSPARTVAWPILIAVDLMCAIAAVVTPPTQASVWLQSAILVNIAVISVLIATRTHRQDLSWLRVACQGALAIVATYSLLQWLLARKGDDALYNPWGSHQYLHEYDFALYVEQIRATGFYLEPSFDALVISTLTFVLIRMHARPIPTIIVGTVGVISTQSLAGIVGILAVIVYAASLSAQAGRVRGPVVRTSILAVGVTLAFSSATYIANRLHSLSITGSSADYRIDAPFSVVRYVIATHPLGEPLGSVQQVVGSFEIYNGTSYGTSLDNGIYLIVFYFGWFGLAALFGTLLVCLFRSVRSRSAQPVAIALFVAVCLINTGGIFTPEFTVLMVIIILSGKHVSPSHSISENRDHAVDSNRQPQQRARSRQHLSKPSLAAGT